ncbi:MAG: nucleotide exchange factor GrpE [Proteobacteria bacterium]|nr:nucleotide exchange factor GrpE [Pseudomonadota bacterium]MCH7981926.1 nucleotide exchange factor GrpE [Pseudomonadota bacterium]
MNGQPDLPDERPEDDIEQDAELAENDVAAAVDPVAELQEVQARADENWDRYLRAAAETENVRKRAARDVENAHKFALENFARDMLAIKDSLELGIQAVESADVETLMAGKEATLMLLSTTLERFGIKELDPQGEPFDPEFHEAVSMQPSTELEPGSVLSVVQKGYSLNGRLLRPAMVVVVAAEASEST